jgi:hypothetical protein
MLELGDELLGAGGGAAHGVIWCAKDNLRV